MLRISPFTLFIASRYFFSKKGTNAVHVISIIAVVAISLIVFTMVSILSVFNGFGKFIDKQFSALTPEYKIVRNDGLPFSMNELPDVDGTGVLVAKAVASIDGSSIPVQLVGVTDEFADYLPIKEEITEGAFDLGNSEFPSAVIGIGVASKLNTGVGYMKPIEIWLPKRLGTISTIFPAKSFRKAVFPTTGIFKVTDRKSVV